MKISGAERKLNMISNSSADSHTKNQFEISKNVVESLEN